MIPIVLSFTKDAELKTIERTLPCHGPIVVLARADDPQQWIIAPILVIVEILIALAYPEYALSDQFLKCERYPFLIAVVDTAGRKGFDKVPVLFDLPQEKQSPVAGCCFAIVLDNDASSFWTL
jgi:hypothetical protein